MAVGVIITVSVPRTVLSQTIQTYDEAAIINPSEVYSTPSAEELQHIQKSLELSQKARKLVNRFGGQCVTFARNFTGATPSDISGMAKNITTNTTTPAIGEIIKTDESIFGHVGVIIGIDGDILTIVDSNYNWDQRIQIRTINLQNPHIMGYIKL